MMAKGQRVNTKKETLKDMKSVVDTKAQKLIQQHQDEDTINKLDLNYCNYNYVICVHL